MKQAHICLDETLGIRYAILPGDPARLDRIAKELEDVQELAYNREFRSLRGRYKGVDVLALSTGIGGSSAGIAVEELHNIGLLNTQIPPRYSTSYFNHVWGGGYAAGYYSYLWTEVLAVNIADYFAKHGALDPAVGQAFRDKILSRGNTKDQLEMFTDFTGMEKPDASGFLKARGL